MAAKSHKPSTMYVNKRAAGAAAPGGCGVAGNFVRCWCLSSGVCRASWLWNKPAFTSNHSTRKGVCTPCSMQRGCVGKTQSTRPKRRFILPQRPTRPVPGGWHTAILKSQKRGSGSRHSPNPSDNHPGPTASLTASHRLSA